MPRSSHCSAAPLVSALLAGGGWHPQGTSNPTESCFQLPKGHIHPAGWLAGLLSLAVSRPVQAQSCARTCEISHTRGMLRAASVTCGHRTHPFPFRLKGHPPQGVTDVPNVQQVPNSVCWQGWRHPRGNTLLPSCRSVLVRASCTKKTPYGLS